MRNWFDRLIRRAFRLGSAVVDRYEQVRGHEQETFAPQEYGNYIATSAAVYTCASLRAKNIAQLPVRLWRVKANGDRTEVTKGQLFDLLSSVNPFWTLGRLLRMAELSLCLWGQSPWALERGKGGRGVPTEIWWMQPGAEHFRPVPHPTDYLSGFIYSQGGVDLAFKPEEVVWLRYENPLDEYSGLSPIAASRLSIDTTAGAMLSNKRMFDQGLQLAGLLSPQNDADIWQPDQTNTLQEMLQRRFSGADKAHRLAVLGQAVKLQTFGIAPKDAQFMELLKWTLEDVCRVYGVPLDLIGGQRTYENVDSAQEALWRQTLIPEAEFIGQELTEQLLPLFPGEADLLTLDYSGVQVLQGDRSAIVEQMTKLFSIGVPLNPLLQEFLPTLLPPGSQGYAWGDTGFLASTLLPAELIVNPPPPPEPKPAPALPPPAAEPEMMAEEEMSPAVGTEAERALALVRAMLREQKMAAIPVAETVKAVEFGSPEHEQIWRAFDQRAARHEARFMKALREAFGRQEDAVLARLRGGKAIKAGDDAADDPFDRAKWGKDFKQLALPFIEEAFADAGRETMRDLELAIGFDVNSPEARRFLEQRAQRFAVEVNETTWETLRASLADGLDAGEGIPALQERVQHVFNIASTSRTELIARTEIVGASNGGALQAAKDSGVVEWKEWLATSDDRTRDSHRAVHGQRRKLDKNFTLAGGNGPAPGQIGVAAEDCNCRCSLTFVVSSKAMTLMPAGRSNGHS